MNRVCGGDRNMSHWKILIGIMLCLGLLINGAFAGQRIKIYDEKSHYRYYIEGNRIYDKDSHYQGNVQEKRIYDDKSLYIRDSY
jgi:predicted membrane-bound spermidine synthase